MAEDPNPYAGAHSAAGARLEDIYRTAYDTDGDGGLFQSPRRIYGPRWGHERSDALNREAGETLERTGDRARRIGNRQYSRFSDPGMNMLDEAESAAEGIGGVRRARAYMDDYMNPFLEEVVRNTRRDLRRERDRDLVGMTGASAASAGAFGGSRHGVREALGDEMFYRTLADASGRLRSEGFTTALDAAEGDRDFLLSRAVRETDAFSGLGDDYLDAAARLPEMRAGLEMETGRLIAGGLGAQADSRQMQADRNLSFLQAQADEPFERLTGAAELLRGRTPSRTQWTDQQEEGSDLVDVLLTAARNPSATGDLIDMILGD